MSLRIETPALTDSVRTTDLPGIRFGGPPATCLPELGDSTYQRKVVAMAHRCNPVPGRTIPLIVEKAALYAGNAIIGDRTGIPVYSIIPLHPHRPESFRCLDTHASEHIAAR